MAYGQPRRCARAGEADEMLGGNIGNEQRRADGEPADVAAGEKIVFGSAFLLREIQTDAKHNGEVNPDNEEIYGGEVPVRNRDLRCEQHPCLLGIL